MGDFLGINWTKVANTAADFTPVGWGSRIANGKGAFTNAKNLVKGAVNGMEGQTDAHVDAAQIGEYDPNAQGQYNKDYADWQNQQAMARLAYTAQHPEDPNATGFQPTTPPPTPPVIDPSGQRLYEDRAAQLRLGNDLGTGYKTAQAGLNADYQPYLSQLQDAANGNAPSQAQDMLRSGTARAQAGAYATGASAPANGATAAAMMSQAGGQAAGVEQQGARDAAQLRAQEISDARTQYGSALGAKYGATSGLLSGEGSAVGSTLGNIAGQDLTRAQTNVGAINSANAANAGIQQGNDERKGQFYRDVVKTVGTAAVASDIRAKEDIQPMDGGGNGKASWLRHFLFGKTSAMGPSKSEPTAVKSTVYPAIRASSPAAPGAVQSTVAPPPIATAPTAPVAPNYAAPLPAALSQPGAAAGFGGVQTVAPVGMDDGGSFQDQTDYAQSLFSDERSKEKIRSLEGQLDEARLGLATQAEQIRGTNAEYPMATDRGRGPKIAPTDLIFSGENGGNMRTPDEQFRYVDSLKRRPAPTPLFFDKDQGGTFRTPVEQARYTEDIRDPRMAHLGLGGDTREALSTVEPYQWRYKPDVAARIGEDTGPRIGVMAQDLQRSPNPAVRSTVIDTPQGKVIDSRRGLSLALAGTAGLNKRVAAIEDALQQPTEYPTIGRGGYR